MAKPPINLALIWHMHQPYYKDVLTQEYVLPWVRLHGIKDYYDMAAILDDYPKMKLTINLVPSLIMQIDDYVLNNAQDKCFILSEKDPADLTLDEKVYILKNFFMANWDIMVKPYKFYHDLLLKRGRFASSSDLAAVAQRFTKQELMDLQVWFNLAWFGFNYRKHDPLVSALIAKGRGFTREEKLQLLLKQKELLSKIVPKHKELMDRGQIELTTSPFYHPILPLLCDSNVAKESDHFIKLPLQRYRHKEDAERQIKDAVEFHAKHFGANPNGMWPSEGSVSEAIIPLIADSGIKWIATDESILSSSLSCRLSPQDLYKPYMVQKDGKSIAIIFRNHFLSDQIGFVYQRWRAKDAAADFKRHLHNIRASLPDDGENYLVSVILDGENAWEYYCDGGEDFLRTFYKEISEDPEINTVKVSDFIAQNCVDSYMPRLFPASWINNNFRIWIGHEEDNKAWDELAKARSIIEGSTNPMAWQELYVAEGSDWCWWYGDDHSSDNDEVFDALFRKHLKNIYNIVGKQPPKSLDLPIKQTISAHKPTKEPVYYIEPILDGVVTNYYEWLSAGCFDIESSKGAMHQIETLMNAFYYGFSKSNVFFRIDCNLDFEKDNSSEYCFSINVHAPKEYKIILNVSKNLNTSKLELYKLLGEKHEKKKDLFSYGIAKIIEIGVPFSDLEALPGESLQFSISVEKDGNELERWPRGGMIAMKVPTQSFEMEQWSV